MSSGYSNLSMIQFYTSKIMFQTKRFNPASNYKI